jgi:nucleoside-diphosphate-sugar epimerase
VTGASGFVGRNLVSALVGEGHSVRAAGTTDAAGLRTAAAGCKLVFHLAGSDRGSPGRLRAEHAGAMANLLDAVELGTRIVYVSSTSVYGWDRLWPVDDTMPTQPTSAYARAKLAAERLVQHWDGGSLVIARPTTAYGIGDNNGILARAVRLLAQPGFRFPGNGQSRMPLTHVDDVVDGLVRLGAGGEGMFILAAPEPLRVSRVLGLLADGADLAPPRFGAPASVVRAAVGGIEAAWSVTAPMGEAPFSRHEVDLITRDQGYSADRARRKLGWSPLIRPEDALPALGAWLARRASGLRDEPENL